MRRLLHAAFSLLILLAGSLPGCAPVSPWPPEVRESYPDLPLFDESGQHINLSELRGRVLLIEPIRMGCAACQSFAGAQRFGAFGAVMPQAGVPPLEQLLFQHAGRTSLRDPEFQVIQIVFFNLAGQPPSPADLRAWSRHFKLHERNIMLLGAPAALSDSQARLFIPGFQLVDNSFVLRSKAQGTLGGQTLYDELLPMIPRLIRGSEVAAR